MRPAQRVGDHRGLLGHAVGDHHADGPGLQPFDGVDVPVGGVAHAARHRQPGGHPAGGGQQVLAAAAAGAQRHDRRGLVVQGPEPLGEVEDVLHLGAPEAVDGLVGVADHDQVAAVPGQAAQQRLLGGVGVLVFVHEHDVVGRPLAILTGPSASSAAAS